MTVFIKSLTRLFCLFLLFFITLSNVEASSFSFDGQSVSQAEFQDFLSPSEIIMATATSPDKEYSLRNYDFKTLYKTLGYSDKYFGAGEDELSDLNSYTSKEDTFYQEINGYLRFYPGEYTWYGTGPEEAKKIVQNIDRIFEKVPALPEDLALFRGVDLSFLPEKGYRLNEEFTEKAYSSTSASFKIAEDFAEMEKDSDKTNAGNKDNRAVFVIYFEKSGVKGVLVDQNEDEVILKHGSHFRVMDKKETGKGYDLYLLQLCSGTCDTFLRKGISSFWTEAAALY